MASSCVVGMFLFVVVMVASVSEAQSSIGGSTPINCKQERLLLVNACSTVLLGHTLSSDCCKRVRLSHVECACAAVTPKLASLLGVDRTIKQIEGCGRIVPRNFKCGSVITP